MTLSSSNTLSRNHPNHPNSFENTIPWVDMSGFIHGSPEEKIAAALQFGNAFQELGFVAVTHIGIQRHTIDQAFHFAESFFAQPEAHKMQVRSPDGHYGFLPFGTEHAKYTNIIDLKEFYQTTGPTQPEHLWPSIPGFRKAIDQLYLELQQCLKYCLQATAIYLGYADVTKRNILADLLGHGNGLLRLLHYPPVDSKKSPPNALRSAEHEDISLMTVIPKASHPGLQVKNHQGDWLDVSVPDDAAIINAGDTLSFITNGIIPSTTHRVINPKQNDTSSRYSMPFFGSLPFNTRLRVLDKCRCNKTLQELPSDITFGEFLSKRYKAIGLK